jgi:hypothetical protein
MRCVRDHAPSRRDVLRPTKPNFLRYRNMFSFTDRIVTGAETPRRRGRDPVRLRAVLYAKSAGNTLLIAL